MDDGDAKSFFKFPGQVVFADIEGLGKEIQREFFGEVFIDIFLDNQHFIIRFGLVLLDLNGIQENLSD